MKWATTWLTIDHDVAMADSTDIPEEYVRSGKKGTWSESDSSTGDLSTDDDYDSELDVDIQSLIEAKLEDTIRTRKGGQTE